jgi:hypothetical protein
MIRNIAIAGIVCLMSTAALAADAKVDSAVKVFAATASDPTKLKTFCEMSEAMDTAGEKNDSAADAKVEGYMKTLGPDFETAWNAGENIDETSADGKALNKAIDDLASKCSS